MPHLGSIAGTERESEGIAGMWKPQGILEHSLKKTVDTVSAHGYTDIS